MLFNSWVFLAFFCIVLALYVLTQRRLSWQNAMLLIASYVFYGWWDWRFLGLVLLSTVIDYVAAIRIDSAPNPVARKRWLMVSMVSNLGVLAGFKYFGFFVDSLDALLHAVGIDGHRRRAADRVDRAAGRNLVLHVPDDELHDRRVPP